MNKKLFRLSIGSNVSLADYQMIEHTVPNWLSVFDNYLDEICLIIDPQKPTGRLGKQYDYYSNLETLTLAVKKLELMDPRIKGIALAGGDQKKRMQRKWFRYGYPERCQSGTPIIAFINALEVLNSKNLALRCDCDMLFYEAGFLDVAYEKLYTGDYDVIEPPLLGYSENRTGPVSLGAFLVLPEIFSKNCLPITPHKIDFLRQIKRAFQGMSPYLNLEEMVKIEKNCGRINHCNLDQSLGWSLHIPNRSDVTSSNFLKVKAFVEKGIASDAQRAYGRNFNPQLWDL
jgi:hypothetical protein